MSAATYTQRRSRMIHPAVRRFFKSPTAILGLGIVLFFIFISLFAPILRPYDVERDRRNLKLRLAAPSWTMSQEELDKRKLTQWGLVFGADELGRDVFSRVLYGGRISLRVGLIAVSLALVVGTFLGVLAGYFRGWVDLTVVWLVDILLAFPGILLAIAIVAILGPSLRNALIAISITQIPMYVRVTRAVVISLRESEYVQAARALGSNTPRIILGHILPNSLSPLIVQVTLSIGTAILDVAALGFLGLGAQPPEPEWGLMIRSGFNQFLRAPWLSIFPGLAIFFSVVGFNLLGDALRDILDPRLKL